MSRNKLSERGTYSENRMEGKSYESVYGRSGMSNKRQNDLWSG